MKQAKIGRLQQIVNATWKKLFGFAKEELPVVIISKKQKSFEIQCTPTYWRFLNEKKQPILDWPMSETIQLLDNKKIAKQVTAHKAEIFDKVTIDFESEDETAAIAYWEKTQEIINHVIQDHFDEVKLDIPVNQIAADINSEETIIGAKNIMTKKEAMFRVPHCVLSGDMMIMSAYTIEWNIVNELLKQEPA